MNIIYRLWGKRLFDLIFSTFSFLLLLPIFFIISLLIKFSNYGSVFFKQTRVGLNGMNFVIYKFRSLPSTTPDIPSDKLENINTKWIGNFIRRSNIDELPQLINIIKGDMSFVGPRPPMLTQFDLIELRRKNGALNCRPGLTGLAQIHSYNGMSVTEKASLDEKYVKKISFISDIKIIIRTFSYLLSPPPKY